MSINKKIYITKKTNLGELVHSYPELARILMEDYGLHCVGCAAASFDTLEDGAKIHGFSDKEVGEMVKRLNHVINSPS